MRAVAQLDQAASVQAAPRDATRCRCVDERLRAGAKFVVAHNLAYFSDPLLQRIRPRIHQSLYVLHGDFEQAAGLKPSGEPNDELLQAIARSPVKAPTASPQRSAQISASARGDAIGDLIAGSPKRVLAVQRALGDFGYGPVKPTGVPGVDTRAAIEKFERERKLPITGQISDRLVRELAVVTGRPLE